MTPIEATISYRGNQALAYTETGDPDGFPILVQHGMIASILDPHLFHRLTEDGRRIISLARPGYGRSSPTSIRDVGEWGEIVSVLVDALGLKRLDVLGISSGAPYAYAIAHALPDRVRTAYVLSGTPALYDPEVQAFWPYPVTPEASIAELQVLAKDLFFPGVAADYASAAADVRDSMANDCFGIALDLHLRCRDWGFRLGDIHTPVVMQHSRADPQVPFAAAERTAGLLPACRLIAREGDDHFSQGLLDGFIDTVIDSIG